MKHEEGVMISGERPIAPRLKTPFVWYAWLAAVALLAWAGPALAQEAGGEDKVAALKQSLQAGLGALRKYEWVETTTLSHKGEQKSTKQSQCYYGADGSLQKIPIAPEQGAEHKKAPRGIRGKIAKKKKGDMAEYMADATALVKRYVPPDPARIQAVKDAGKMSFHPLAADKLQLQFRDYLKAGDVLSVYLDPSTNHLTGVRVSTHLGEPDDLVTLDVTMNTLSDGAVYPSEIVLVAQSKEIKVDIRNSGHRLMHAPGKE